jgi:hypothetical protein
LDGADESGVVMLRGIYHRRGGRRNREETESIALKT